jgi:defect-in-organelle-trafficking protein DotC
MSIVREQVLREAAESLGARRGLRDKSCAISAEVEPKKADLEVKYRFSDLMMGRGILPPVISEARDSVALDATVMRVASRVYRLDEAARVVDIAPTWRDWLYVGLSMGDCARPQETVLDLPDQLRPRDERETEFFKSVVARSYSAGMQQGSEIFRQNLARLERAYFGMRRFFDLHARGMVSAPVVVSNTDITKRDDPNTLIVGNTIIRITVPVDFVEAHQQWKPLAQ